MKNLRNAWNMAESAMESPVLNEELMSHIAGGKPGTGYIKTISGECNSSGTSCGEMVDKILDEIKKIFF